MTAVEPTKTADETQEGHQRSMSVDVRHGDCLTILRDMPDNSVDSVVTDPPYGLSNTKPAQVADVLAAWVTGGTEAVPAKNGGFMGKDWDSFVPPPAVWAECLRVLKPGGHMAVFAGSRTQDLMGLSIRLAGFEIRDTLGWIYGSGFPKSLDVSKAIDKAAGAEREVVGPVDTAPATPEAKQWDGWGTALKPAIEPIILARKPLDGTVAANVLEWGVGGLNIDACRVETDEDRSRPPRAQNQIYGGGKGTNLTPSESDPAGRFPANVLLDPEAAAAMDQQSGVLKSGVGTIGAGKGSADNASSIASTGKIASSYGDSGGASRFFPVFKYQAKAPKRERPVIEHEDGTRVQHPTVKPLALMEWLVTLITPPGGTVLDPFAGTGTTLQAARDKGFAAIGVEQDADYIRLIEARLVSPTPDR